MRFGPVPPDEAVGAILVHSARLKGVALKKGRVLSADDVAALKAAGIGHVTAACLDSGDVGEDAAAARIAKAVAGSGLTVSAAFTGRVNLFASARGLCVVDVERLNGAEPIGAPRARFIDPPIAGSPRGSDSNSRFVRQNLPKSRRPSIRAPRR